MREINCANAILYLDPSRVGSHRKLSIVCHILAEAAQSSVLNLVKVKRTSMGDDLFANIQPHC